MRPRWTHKNWEIYNKQYNVRSVSDNSRKSVEKSSNDRIDRSRTAFKSKKGYDKELFISSEVKETSDETNLGQMKGNKGQNGNALLVSWSKVLMKIV